MPDKLSAENHSLYTLFLIIKLEPTELFILLLHILDISDANLETVNTKNVNDRVEGETVEMGACAASPGETNANPNEITLESTRTFKVSVDLHCPSDNIVNETIERTMKSLSEMSVGTNSEENSKADRENQSNEEIEQTAHIVHSFHDYCASPQRGNPEEPADNGEEGPGGLQDCGEGNPECNPEDQEINYDEQWKAFWDEHYQEVYWYYYNKYQEWFPEGMNSENIDQTVGTEQPSHESIENDVDDKEPVEISDIVLSQKDDVSESAQATGTEMCACDEEGGSSDGEGEPADGKSGRKRRKENKSNSKPHFH